MPLAANSKLGPYEIKSTLGVGGMGEVYRARDSRLNRDVAIKVLRVDSAPIQLTHEKQSVFPMGWSSDRDHILVQEVIGDDNANLYKLLSVATVGGDPEFVMDFECIACDISRDGKVLASRTKDKYKDGISRIAICDPIGSPLKTYASDPSASKELFAIPTLAFAPDGKKILYSHFVDNKVESWLIPTRSVASPRSKYGRCLPCRHRLFRGCLIANTY